MDAAVKVNQPVVADAVPFLSAVHRVYVGYSHVSSFRRGRTMNDNSVNASHVHSKFGG